MNVNIYTDLSVVLFITYTVLTDIILFTQVIHIVLYLA